LETPAASNLRAPTRPMARAPVGNAKTHSTPSHYDGVEHKWWLPSSSPPPPLPPWASSRRPRHHIRRRLRRAARCVGAFAAAPAQHARALRAIVLRARAGPSLGVRAQLLCSARASKRVAKGARRSMANGEMVGGSAVLRRAWSRPQQGRRRACARGKKKVGARTDARIKGGPSQYPERLLRSPFSGSPGLAAHLLIWFFLDPLVGTRSSGFVTNIVGSVRI
jgi:hypothetical protein